MASIETTTTHLFYGYFSNTLPLGTITASAETIFSRKTHSPNQVRPPWLSGVTHHVVCSMITRQACTACASVLVGKRHWRLSPSVFLQGTNFFKIPKLTINSDKRYFLEFKKINSIIFVFLRIIAKTEYICINSFLVP